MFNGKGGILHDNKTLNLSDACWGIETVDARRPKVGTMSVDIDFALEFYFS